MCVNRCKPLPNPALPGNGSICLEKVHLPFIPSNRGQGCPAAPGSELGMESRWRHLPCRAELCFLDAAPALQPVTGEADPCAHSLCVAPRRPLGKHGWSTPGTDPGPGARDPTPMPRRQVNTDQGQHLSVGPPEGRSSARVGSDPRIGTSQVPEGNYELTRQLRKEKVSLHQPFIEHLLCSVHREGALTHMDHMNLESTLRHTARECDREAPW